MLEVQKNCVFTLGLFALCVGCDLAPSGAGVLGVEGGGVLPLTLGGTPGPQNFAFEGTASSGYAGYAVADVGDFNGDGETDYLVGAYGENAAFLVLGGPWLANLSSAVDLDAQTNPNVVGIFGEAAGDRLGRRVAGAGDVNGDGLADLVVGAEYADAAGSNAGAAYIIFGHTNFGWGFYASGIRSGAYPAIALDGEAASDYAGRSVGAAGDFNGDGLSDVVIGASGADPGGASGAGKAYVVFGQATWTGIGHAPVGLGSLVGAGTGAEISGEYASGYLGYAVDAAGDFNGDGIGDVVVGAYRAPGSSANYAGRAYVVYGRTSGFSIDVATELSMTEVLGTEGSAYLGWAVAGGGDFNRDGFDDVVLGSPYADTPGMANAGAAFVVLGGNYGSYSRPTNKLIADDLAVEFWGASAFDYFGSSVALGRDFNGDGLDDVGIGAPSADPAGLSASGQAYVAYGADDVGISDQPVLATDLQTEVGGLAFDGEDIGDAVGRAVAFAADPTGGDPLMFIGASHADRDASTSNSGRAYLTRPDPIPGSYYALNRGPDTAPDVLYAIQGDVVSGPAPGVLDNDIDHDGDGITAVPLQVVTSAGCTMDVLADGSFVVSPPSSTWWGVCEAQYTAVDDHGAQRSEWLRVVYRLVDLSVADLVATGTGQVYNGELSGDGAGYSVDVVPDVDGDGNDDWILGAYGHDVGGPWSGRVYLVHGASATGEYELGPVASGAAGVAFDGEFDFDWLGLEVAAGGDFNADGAPEILIGAIGFDGAGERSGRVYQIDPAGLSSGSPWSVGQTGLGITGVVYDGVEALDDTGRSLGPAGDLNDDGLLDVFVGAYRAADDIEYFPDYFVVNAEEVGVLYVAYGAAGPLDDGNPNTQDLVDLGDVGDSVSGLRRQGDQERGYFGYSIDDVGDFNGDGVSDIVIGAPGESPGFSETDDGGLDAGQSYIVLGSNSLLPLFENVAQNERILLEGGPYEAAGRRVAGVGDVNGDGFDDVLVGAPAADQGAGRAYLVFGAALPAGLASDMVLPEIVTAGAGIILFGESAGDGLGSAAAGIGDFDGDGVEDFAVSAPFADSSAGGGTGRLYVVLGGDDLQPIELDVSDLGPAGYGFAIGGGVSGDALGIDVAGGADINGDGLDDLVVGAHQASPPGRASAGRAYVVFGFTQETPGA